MTPKARRQRLAQWLSGYRLSPADLDVLCATSGVTRRVWRNAIAGRPVNADAHLAICHASGVAPDTVSCPAGPAPRGPVCWASLGAGMRVTRSLRGHSSRQAARIAGVSLATVSRCESGRRLSFDALARLCGYLGRAVHECTAPAVPRPVRQDAPNEGGASAGATGNIPCNGLTLRGDLDDPDL